jgi:hypothetical protein
MKATATKPTISTELVQAVGDALRNEGFDINLEEAEKTQIVTEIKTELRKSLEVIDARLVALETTKTKTKK